MEPHPNGIAVPSPRDEGSSSQSRPTIDLNPNDDDPRRVFRDLAPWALTFLLHSGLVIVAILIVFTRLPLANEEVIRPTIGPLETVRMTSWNDAQQQSESESRPRNLMRTDTRKHTPVPSPIDDPTDLLGKRGGESAPPVWGQGGIGDGPGLFGLKPGPRGTTARTFAYVIDASGSMLDTMPFVIAELKRSIRSLSDGHRFTVIFYQGDQVLEAGGAGLRAGTEANKQHVFNWMDEHMTAAAGLSNPLKAMRRALSYRPQVMFLLSDNITGRGEFEISQTELLAIAKQMNDGGTRINTIQFLYPDPLEGKAGMTGTLKLLSEQTGGLHRFVSGAELGLH